MPNAEPEMRRYKVMFFNQRDAAKRRGIAWDFTFEQWLKVWQDSRHLHERGRRVGQFQMARNGDTGPYAASNVRIVPIGVNLAERDVEKFRGENSGKSKLTEALVREIRSSKESHRAISCRLGVSYGVVYDVRTGRAWNHIVVPVPDLSDFWTAAAQQEVQAIRRTNALAQYAKMTPDELRAMSSNGGKKAHEAKDADGKSLLASRMGRASIACTTAEYRHERALRAGAAADHRSERARNNHRRAAILREAKRRAAREALA